MELKNIILFILLVLTVIAMSFANLTDSEIDTRMAPESQEGSGGGGDVQSLGLNGAH